MKILSDLHDKQIHGRRVKVLRQHIVGLLPTNGVILDVGCGDGLLAGLLNQDLPESKFIGLDVLVRDDTHIPIQEFDGVTIPMADNSVDAVMMIDVLHHTEEPEVLLREAKRVSRNWIVIKDHTRDGLLANATLRFMDWVGNAKHGVALPYNYLSKSEWDLLLEEAGLKVDHWINKPKLYGQPGDWIFGRSLHFVARLAVG